MNARVSIFGIARQVWQIFDARQRRECIGVLLASIAAGCVTLAGIAGIAPFLAVLADPTSIDRNVMLARAERFLTLESREDFLVALGVGFVAVVVLANALHLAAMLAINGFSQRAVARFHVLLFEEYLHRPFAFHARSNADVLSSHVVQEVSRTAGGVIQGGLTAIANAGVSALIVAAVVVVDPVLASSAAAGIALAYVLLYLTVRRRLRREGAAIAALWDARARVVAASFAAIKDVILHRAQPAMAAQVARHSEAIAAAQARTNAMALGPRYLLESLALAGLVAAALAIHRRADGGEWLSHLAFLGFAAYRLLPSLQQVFAGIARVRSDGAGFERIADDLLHARRRSAPHAPPDARNADWASRPRHEIRLVGVSYRHSAGGTGGVHDVSLVIPAGAIVALAGPNGSGKTTLANVLLGLLVPDAGDVLIDGVPLDDRNRRHWLGAVAHVPQEIVLLDASIAENVAFGAPRDAIDLERVRQAVRLAGLGPVVDALPNGLATGIGANGSALSGGQRQRLVIARAIYRNASLLVLDEATSALDAAAEEDFLALLDSLRGERTIVLTTPRARTLCGCDVVLELERGRLVAARTGGGTLAARTAEAKR